MNRRIVIAALFVFCFARAWATDIPPNQAGATVLLRPAVEPKALSDNVKKGLTWLVNSQHPDGSWGQGEESANMGRGTALKDTPNVADTCIATLSLLRTGSTPKEGEYSKPLQQALKFICGEIWKAEGGGLFITELRGTRTQQKLGQFIDTFLAAQVLAQVKDKMPDAESTQRVAEAFGKVMDKIETNQKPDGSWGNDGWAGSLSQSMAGKALNIAAQSSSRPSAEGSLRKANDYAREQSGLGGAVAESPAAPAIRIDASKSAGVELYARASSLSGMQDYENTSRSKAPKLSGELTELDKRESASADLPLDQQKEEKGKIDKRRGEVKDELKSFEDNRKALELAQTAVVQRMEDKQFASGFGSNGGEEFLSHMQIGESLVTKGGDVWQKWDKEMTANLNRIQNDDGSWTGHHCITGRTFCTSAALLVLMSDRALVPVGQKITK
jgi:hypothetical protein